MRYTLYRFKKKPTNSDHATLWDVVGMREYKERDAATAMGQMRPADDRNSAYIEHGYTHYGLFETPRFGERQLVHTEEIKP
jgi:hypothetical protein